MMTMSSTTTATTSYGDLHNYTTGDYIRPATRRELQKSLAAGPEGAFDLEGVTVAVIGGEQAVVCGRKIETDISGVGHCWLPVVAGDLWPSEINALAEDIMEEDDDTGRMIPSASGKAIVGGARYRWGH
jgi:hypothetical protein